MRALSTLKEW